MRTCQHNDCKGLVFRTDKITRKGYCRFHWKSCSTDLDKRTIIQKAAARAKENGNATNQNTSSTRKEYSQELKEWFAYHMINAIRVCENCGRDLSRYKEKDWYGCQHHLLEKSLFPSIEALKENHAVLGKWCCHSVWHSSWMNASQMKIFPEAIKRIEKFYHKIKEKRALPELIQQEINPEII